jgi:transposase-like protein
MKALRETLRAGLQRLLTQAIEEEACDWIDQHAHLKDRQDRRLVVRNGRLPKRQITTTVGQVEIKQPRILDRRPPGESEDFASRILPPYERRTRSSDDSVIRQYLMAFESGDWLETLRAVVGHDMPGLPTSTRMRLQSVWELEYGEWSKRLFQGKPYAYVWAVGVQLDIAPAGAGMQIAACDRPDDDHLPPASDLCDTETNQMLVLTGMTTDESQELIAARNGFCENEQHWTDLLLELKARGMRIDQGLASADPALGFWRAYRHVYA